MELFFIHLLKSSSILLLFLLSYYLFLRKETFFGGNRLFLLAGLVIAISLPFITITKTIIVDPSPMLQNDFYMIKEITANTAATPSFSWISILIGIYLLGVLYFSVKLLIQLNTIKRIKKTSDISQNERFYHVKTKKQISPFSFFKHIFYYPRQFKETELTTIIEHEKVHARELHSIDILVTEVLFILLWFNPIIWFYRMSVKQNLEFLADAKTCTLGHNKKHYQYLMLKQALGNHNLSIANPFFNSIIKKRIVMLNQNQSKAINRLKLIIVLPFLVVFLFAFNTKEVYKTVTTKNKSFETNILDKSFNVIITKNTTNEELKKLKEDLAINEVDFSYTTVRNQKSEIIDIQMDLRGKNTNNEEFQLSYDSDSEHPIEELLIFHDEISSAFYIGKKNEKEKLLKRDTIGGLLKSSRENSTITRVKNDNVNDSKIALTIDKNTSDQTLLQNTANFEERGINIQFKNIKRNSRGEIRGIKVVYNNGLGDKGTYQQKKTTTITPFIVAVNFVADSPAEITVSTVEITSSFEQPTNTLTSKNSSKIINQEDTFIADTLRPGHYNNPVRLISQGPNKPLYFVDGEEVENIDSMTADEIDSMEVIKGKLAQEKYGLKGANGVVMVTTKLSAEAEPLYYIDDKKSTKKIATALDPDKIKSVNVFKGKQAEKKYGEEGKNGVVEIIIKTAAEEEQGKNVIDEVVNKFPKDAEPLYLIDGKEFSKEEMMGLNPDNIESMFILKDKNGVDKYGEKGKNGVVLITTKKN